LSFEVVSTNSHRILASTCAHYGTRNDKTIVRFVIFVIDMRTKGMYSNVVFYLYDSVGTLHEWNGAYLIADGGYHKVQVPSFSFLPHLTHFVSVSESLNRFFLVV